MGNIGFNKAVEVSRNLRFYSQKQAVLYNGAPANHPTVIYSPTRCEAFPSAKVLVPGT
jgi:hypothetical protein